MIYDVAVIGCGIIGSSIAFELSAYNVSVVVLEKENDVACGTTKANSAIVHAGFDGLPGTLIAKLNVSGSKMMEKLCSELSVHYRKTGSLVLAFDDPQKKMLQELYDRGIQNGVEGLKIINPAEIRILEPNVSSEAVAALHAPSGAIISPWQLCLAQIETAVLNGAVLLRESRVEKIERVDGVYHLHAGGKTVQARYIVNAAGLYADEISSMVSPESEFKIFPNKGEYFLLDKSQGNLVGNVIFQAPSEKGKGVLVAPTVHGNLIVGPDSVPVADNELRSTSKSGLDFVRETALLSVPGINLRETIRTFTGLRAYSNENDFIIRNSAYASNFINVAGIKSPGLSAAPAIGVYVLSLLSDAGLELGEKRERIIPAGKAEFKELSPEAKNEIIKNDPSYGHIICRCETVTEGEIKNVLGSAVPPVSLDGVKRRTCAGMGRCQGGFCGPKVLAAISEELKMKPEDVVLENSGSYILTGPTKGGGFNEK